MGLGENRIVRTMVLGLASCALIAVGSMAEAQRTARNTSGPAEIPPASYTASQYVDSQGCVFIRAGVGGETRWVPRVNRDRTVVCGQTASRPATEAAAAPARVEPVAPVAPVTAPVIRRAPAPAAPRQVVQAAPVATPAPAPRQVARVAAPRQAVRPVAPRPAAVRGPVGCGASDLSARFLRGTPGCAAALSGAANGAPAAPVVATAPATPRRAVRAQRTTGATLVNPDTPSPNRSSGSFATTATRDGEGNVLVPAARTTFDVLTPPPGYRSSFTDGRLNPNRGPRTLQGDFQSQAVWTNETPRRLRGFIRVQR